MVTFKTSTTWMDPEGVMLSKMLDREREIPYDPTGMWNLKNKTNEQNKVEIHSYV